jgi:hypothetical protein
MTIHITVYAHKPIWRRVAVDEDMVIRDGVSLAARFLCFRLMKESIAAVEMEDTDVSWKMGMYPAVCKRSDFLWYKSRIALVREMMRRVGPTSHMRPSLGDLPL